MKVAIVGQQDFGKAVLEAFLARKDQVAGVFCAPEKPGARPDALKVAAQERAVDVFQFASLKSAEAKKALKDLNVELGIMAFVLQFAPQDFVKIPKHGTIQYHPSLLPRYRGPSSINWPIIRGDTKTGLTIFRPTDGLDEGPVILQKETPIGPDDTLGTVYFVVQDESQATYEGWCRKQEARINWANHVDFVYNLIRGCNPAPGAWCTLEGKELQVFDARKHSVRTFGAVKGRIGEVVEVSAKSFQVTAQGGRVEVLRAKLGDGKKLAAAELLASGVIKAGQILA
jgi:methionyl-tRNA formyltransferase